MGTRDGCGKQCKCSTTISFMSALATGFGIVVDRALCAPGHGKSEVDALNGVDKNTIHRMSMMKVADENVQLKAHTSTKIEGEEKVSPAEDCKRILEMAGSEGVKSEVKREKRERERAINKRFWHVRGTEVELDGIKCDAITHQKFEKV